MQEVSFTDLEVATFIVLPVLLVAALIAGVWWSWRQAGESAPRAWRAAAILTVASAAWMAVTWELAAFGTLRQWNNTPPPFGVLVFAIVVIALRLTFSTVGRRLATYVPLWALVAVQTFRYPLELAMHRLADRGIMPQQMSYSGRNFDIVTGITAALVAGFLVTGRAGRTVVLAWNVLGSLLLLNIVTIAILSTPRFRAFGDDRLNVFVTYPPFVWLPAILVLAAMAGHLVIFRAAMVSKDLN